MRRIEIEHWVFEIIRKVEQNQPVEDSRVELKATWISSQKAARRIAGHANSAHGESILWIVGVDEKSGVIGADRNEFANWWVQVQSQFDGGSPEMTDLNIAIPGTTLTVVALLFATDRAPFVVKNSDSSPDLLEVPWRDGTRVRSATRADLLRILIPLHRNPTIEVLGGKMQVGRHSGDRKWHWFLNMQLYVASNVLDQIVIPFHKSNVWIEMLDRIPQTYLTDLSLRAPKGGTGAYSQFRNVSSLTIDSTNTELLINGPGEFFLHASEETEPTGDDIRRDLRVIISLLPTDSDRSVVLDLAMNWDGQALSTDSEIKGLWTVGRAMDA